MSQLNFKEHILSNSVFDAVVQAAKELNIEGYVVGGYVRDLILKRPSKDIDFVCVGSGIEWALKVSELIPYETHVTVFKTFGTAQIKAQDWELEFVGARKESYREDSRKPLVENGTLQDDQNRRDFTINALAISLNQDNLGEVIDPFDGIKHIKQKLIKTPLEPSITFSDDPLRMMRAIRFATQLEFDIEPDTYDALSLNKERINIISKERISDELNKIILSKKPSYGFNMLFQTEILHIIFPEMVLLHGIETIEGKSHKDNFYHTLQVLDNICPNTDDLWLRWAAILHDIAKPQTKRFHPKIGWTFHGHEDKGSRMVSSIFKNLKLPLNEKMRYVQKLVKLHLRPIALIKNEITDSAIRRLLFETGEDIDDLMCLCRADITSKNGERIKKYLKNFDIVEEKLKRVEEEDKLRNFQPIVTGELIMEVFEIAPGRLVGDIKTEIREAILEGKIKNTVEDAIPLLHIVGKNHNLKLKIKK
jgi:poly(A) polymerase